MLKRVKGYSKALDIGFFLFLIAIILIVIGTLTVGRSVNREADPEKVVIKENNNNRKKVIESLCKDFDLNAEFINELVKGRAGLFQNNELLKLTEAEISNILNHFDKNNDLICEVFFSWDTDEYYEQKDDNLYYKKLIYLNSNSIGVAGFQIDPRKLEEKVKRMSPKTENQKVSSLAKKERDKYALIILICIFAVVTILLIYRSSSKKRSLYDILTDRIIKKYKHRLSPTKVKGQRAVIALHVGLASAILSDVIYYFVLQKSFTIILDYVYPFLIVLALICLYSRSKMGLTPKMTKVIIAMGFTIPVIQHLRNGGFAAGGTGEDLLWLIVILYVSLFILGSGYSIKIFNLFGIILFLDLLIEIFFLHEANYERVFNFFASFFFLGLISFATMEIYVSSSRKDYRRMEDLLRELEENQALLIQNEKMGTLGQLISGVAHEINTPIGAIKASIETMEDSFERFLRKMMENGEIWDDVAYEKFEQIISMSVKAKSEMMTTMEIRQKKKELVPYFEQHNLEDGETFVRHLVRLEIVDLDEIKKNINLFTSERTLEILEVAVAISPFLSGIPSIIYAADRVSQIVSALKSYVHTNADEEELDVVKSIENVLILYRNQLKSNITLITDYEEDLPCLHSNAEEMSQVWTNLIQNALYEMKEQGGILKISVKTEADFLKIKFQDSGKGIDDSVREKIFSPFFTTKPTGEGCGLGLNISQRIVKQNGGTIEIVCQEGQGAQFVISMPLL